MWIELLKETDGHKVGSFLEVEEAIGRSYIGAGLAADGGEGPDTVILKRALDDFRGMLKGFVDGTASEIRAAGEAALKRTNVRGAGAGVEFNSIENGESEADKSRSMGDFFRSAVGALSLAMTGNVEGAVANHKRLTEVYKVQRNGDVSRGMTEGAGSSLGYTTPVIYETMISAEAAEEQVFLKGARRIPLGARQVEYPALDQYRIPTAGNSASYGGVQVFRKGENTQRTQTQVNAKKVVMVAQDLTAFFELSRDLLADSSAVLDSLIPQLGGEAIGWRSDWEAFQGTGIGQLMGLLNSPAMIFVTRAASGHFTYPDAFAMYVRLLPRAKKGAAWYAHPFAMADIMKLKDDSGRNVYLPVIPGSTTGPIGLTPSGFLLGLPIFESEKCSPLGTSGDVNLFAMDRYLYGERSGLEVGLSEHFLFDTDQVAVRLKVRNDGKPQLLKPIYLGDGSGSNQVSAFVGLTT